MKTNTRENGLETLIVRQMTGVNGLAGSAVPGVAEPRVPYGGTGWIAEPARITTGNTRWT